MLYFLLSASTSSMVLSTWQSVGAFPLPLSIMQMRMMLPALVIFERQVFCFRHFSVELMSPSVPLSLFAMMKCILALPSLAIRFRSRVVVLLKYTSTFSQFR